MIPTLALRNITKRKKRAVLTILSIFIGIAAVVALASLGQGLEQAINEEFEKVGADKIIIQPKDAASGSQFSPGKVTTYDVDVIEKARGVTVAAGHLMRSTQVQFNNLQRTRFLMSFPAVQERAKLMRAFWTADVEVGRFLSHKDKAKMVVGYNLGFQTTFNKNIVIGDKVLLNNTPFEVVGILGKTGDPVTDGSVIIPEEDARTLLNEPTALSMVVAQSAKGEDPEIVAKSIESVMRKDRNLKEGKENFNVQSSTELIESFNIVLSIVQIVFIGIGAISLVVGGIGIMNTMYTAVLERTKEIGIMKAVGAQNRDIFAIFLLESSLLGLLGGIFGVSVGIAIAKTVEFIATNILGQVIIKASLNPAIIVGSLIFAFVMGTISGFLPAYQASHLKPIDALRYE